MRNDTINISSNIANYDYTKFIWMQHLSCCIVILVISHGYKINNDRPLNISIHEFSLFLLKHKPMS